MYGLIYKTCMVSYVSKETYINMSKETCIYAKRPTKRRIFIVSYTRHVQSPKHTGLFVGLFANI